METRHMSNLFNVIPSHTRVTHLICSYMHISKREQECDKDQVTIKMEKARHMSTLLLTLIADKSGSHKIVFTI